MLGTCSMIAAGDGFHQRTSCRQSATPRSGRSESGGYDHATMREFWQKAPFEKEDGERVIDEQGQKVEQAG